MRNEVTKKNENMIRDTKLLDPGLGRTKWRRWKVKNRNKKSNTDLDRRRAQPMEAAAPKTLTYRGKKAGEYRDPLNACRDRDKTARGGEEKKKLNNKKGKLTDALQKEKPEVQDGPMTG